MSAAATTPTIRVMVADDHAVVREGLIAILNRQPDIRVIAEACDGAAAIGVWDRVRPDVALVDLRMPGLDGVAVTAALRAREPKVKVIILTTFDGDEDITRGLEAGASAYLLKDATPDELAECVRRVRNGDVFVAPSLAGRLVLHLRNDPLTARERDVLEELGRGRSNRAIAEALGIAEGTVKLHMKNILSKLDASSRADAIVIAIRRGFLKTS
jgi:two-component system NarL family response regulator